MGVFRSIGRFFVIVGKLPFALVPWREMKASKDAIRDHAAELWSQARRGAEVEQQVILDGDRLVDLSRFAQQKGLSEGQARAVLARRRRETARTAYACFVLGWAAFGFLCYRISNAPFNSRAVVTALEFTPFSILFFLMAFRFALDNFRLRMLRHATAGEFLRTNEPFWPR